MEPPIRSGFIGDLSKKVELTYYAAYFGTDTTAFVEFQHACDGYTERRQLKIVSIERKQYPNPHIMRGVLEIDHNRPGQDAGDDVEHVKVVIELWSYPRVMVYDASRYVSVMWSTVEDLPTGSLFRYVIREGPQKIQIKMDDDTYRGAEDYNDDIQRFDPFDE